MGEILREEVATHRSIDCARLIAWDYCGSLRGLIISLARGGDTPTLVQMRDKMIKSREEVVTESANPVEAKERILHIANMWLANLRPIVVADLRNGRIDDSTLLGFIKLNADMFFEQMMDQDGLSENEVTAFRLTKPMHLRYFYLLVRHSLRWTARGGLLSARPETALNHMIDQEYVAIASFFDGFLSSDREALDAYNDLRILLDDEVIEAHEQSACEYVAALDGRVAQLCMQS